MKNKIINAALLLSLVSAGALAKSEAIQVAKYNVIDPIVYAFGEKTQSSKTFVYEKTKNDNQVVRLEFHVEEFPYNAKFELGGFEDAYQAVLPQIKQKYKNESIDRSHLKPIDQSVAVDIYEIRKGHYSTNLTIHAVSGFTATTIPEADSVIVLASSLKDRRTGSGLSSDFVAMSSRQDENGSEKSVWYYTD